MKRVASSLVAVVAVILGMGVFASPAQAALPYCNNIAGWKTGGHWVYYESWRSGSTVNDQCDMYTNTWGTQAEKNAIKTLQHDINTCYYWTYVNGVHKPRINITPLTTDGLYGANTKAAVTKVQQWINANQGGGLATDGWAGPMTRKAMDHVSIAWPDEGCYNAKYAYYDGSYPNLPPPPGV